MTDQTEIDDFEEVKSPDHNSSTPIINNWVENNSTNISVDEPRHISDAIEEYISLRDDLTIHRKQFQELEKVYKARMEYLSMWLREKGDDLGVNSFSTKSGSAFRVEKTRYLVAAQDWELFMAWVASTKNFQCIEKRPAQLAVKDIVNVEGSLPPGVVSSVEIDFEVRRPKK